MTIFMVYLLLWFFIFNIQRLLRLVLLKNIIIILDIIIIIFNTDVTYNRIIFIIITNLINILAMLNNIL